MRQKLAAGNWKMNGTQDQLGMLAQVPPSQPGCEVLICPPAQLLIPAVQQALGRLSIGAQDCHAQAPGAHTGDLSASMIADTGARYVILGHSERRQAHGETDALIQAKAAAAIDAGLCPIICIGESHAQRTNGQALDVIQDQLRLSLPDHLTQAPSVIAYEPIWAIGTGLIPSLDQITKAHSAIRAHLRQRFGAPGNDVRLLYGGSVKPDNAAQIFACPEVDGALVGGASLSAEDFGPIITALAAA